MDVSRPHILVVDDEPDTADSMAVLLGLWGYAGVARYDGAAALAAARARPPAVVLLDLEMSGMDGFEFVRRLRGIGRCARTAVVMVSGYTDEKYRTRAREIGIIEYLVKPVATDPLRALLGSLIGGPDPRTPTPNPGTGKRNPLPALSRSGFPEVRSPYESVLGA